jgi:uncharacterized membrane protein
MATALLLLGAAIIAATAIVTSQRYANLPDRIPIHFGISGIVDNYGPRYMAWVLVAIALTFGIVQLVNYELTNRLALLALGVIALAILLVGQILILNTARSGKTRVNLVWFWVFLAFMLALGILAVRTL